MSKRVWLLGWSGGIYHRELDPLRLLLTQSGTNFSNKHILATIIAILNFKISGRGGVGDSRAPTPLYVTLSGVVNSGMVLWLQLLDILQLPRLLTTITEKLLNYKLHC